MNNFQEKRVKSISAILMVAVVIISIFAGGFIGYLLSYFTTTKRLYNMENQLSKLQKQIENLQQTQNTVNITHILIGNVSLSKLYERVRDSVVVIRGLIVQHDIWGIPYYIQVQGSGFVYNFTARASRL